MKKFLWIAYLAAFVCVVLLFLWTEYRTERKYDERIEEQRDSIAFLTGEVERLNLEFLERCDSVSFADSIIYENLVLRYKINRIKQYDSIVMRNSSQSKYFRGWVRRVIYD